MRTLVDCGCETKVHKDGSGVEIYLCPLHKSAPLGLELAQMVVTYDDPNSAEPLYYRIVAKARELLATVKVQT